MKRKKIYLESTGYYGGFLVEVKNDNSDLLCYNTSIAMQFDSVADAKKFLKHNNRVGKYKAINEKTPFIQ